MILWKCEVKGKGTSDKASIIRAVKKTKSVAMSTKSKVVPPYAVINPGAKKEILGGLGWYILHFSDKSESLNGALSGMGSEILPSVDAVTCVYNINRKAVFLGVGEAAYDRRSTRVESLWNSHYTRSNKVVVDDVAKSQGGDNA